MASHCVNFYYTSRNLVVVVLLNACDSNSPQSVNGHYGGVYGLVGVLRLFPLMDFLEKMMPKLPSFSTYSITVIVLDDLMHFDVIIVTQFYN